AAAERIALHQRDAVYVAIELRMESVHALDALACVGKQVFAVARPYEAAEQVQVAAEIEDIGIGREHDVREALVAIGGLQRQSIAEAFLEVTDFLDQQRAEARSIADFTGKSTGMHEAPA